MDTSVKDKMDIQILDRTYPIEVSPDNRAALELVVSDLNQKLNLFKSKYSNKDKQDSLAMVALQLAVELSEFQQEFEAVAEAEHLLNKLNDALDQVV
jgi:cell division protein ZapA (FtsZ GTPase activity inhibitor)